MLFYRWSGLGLAQGRSAVERTDRSYVSTVPFFIFFHGSSNAANAPAPTATLNNLKKSHRLNCNLAH
jgi:hypothetical protein